MSNNYTQELTQLLADTSQPDWKRSAQALALVFSWNRAAFEKSRGSRAVLLQAIHELAKALAEGQAGSTAIEPLVEQAMPGQSLRNALKIEQESISRREAETKALQSDLTRLEQLELANRSMMAEFEELKARQDELAHIEKFDPSLVDSLRKQVEEIESSKPWLRDVQQLTAKLKKGIPLLSRAFSEALLVMKEEDRRELGQARSALEAAQAEAARHKEMLMQAERDVQAARAELSTMQERYQNIQNELTQRRAVLDQYIQADREIAAAISSSSTLDAQQALDTIEAQLHSVDEALQRAIEANTKARAMPVIDL